MTTNSNTSITALLSLPDEIIQHILSFAPWRALVACQFTSKRLCTLAEYPLLWKQHYLSEYPTWHPDGHRLRKETDGMSSNLSWKQLLIRRKILDRQVTSNLDQAVETQYQRYQRLKDITDTSYEAKEVLLKLTSTPNDVEDVLARRYWSLEALGCVERSNAIREWQRLADGEDIPLERALCAYDLIAAERPPETLDQVSLHLDMLAQDFKTAHQKWDELGIRDRSMALAAWLHTRNYMGVGNKPYESLQNNFISIALCEPDHPSLPLISVSIFCCIAQRLGINAKPCGFPFHVLAIIEASTGTSSPIPFETIYLDPYTDGREIPITSLRTQLSGYGVTNSTQQDEYLAASSTTELIIRVARNIIGPEDHPVRTLEGDYCSVLESLSPDASRFLDLPPSAQSNALHTTVDRHRARYAAYWAAVIFTSAPGSHLLRGDDVAGPLNELLTMALPRFRVDLHLFTRHIVPLLAAARGARADIAGRGRGPRDLLAGLSHVITQEEEEDTTHPVPKPRMNLQTTPKHHVGHLFQHARYGYIAAITGWDTTCTMSESWIRQMGVDRLGGGRDQCFYHAVVEDESTRYVAEENILCLSDCRSGGGGVGHSQSENGIRRESYRGRDMPEGLRRVAGRWFKRWDKERGAFVSNVIEEYPDD